VVATAKQILHRRIEEIEAAVAEASFIVLRPRILIHEPAGPSARPCACCGSRHARVAEERPLPEFAIDCATGARLYRDRMSPEAWAAVSEDADTHDVPLRLSHTQARAVLEDDGRHVLASGGNRSAKTTAGLIFLALQWLRRGGPLRRFWLVASTQPKGFRLLEKLVLGTGESPPILPQALVRSMPETHRSSSLLTTLIDGSLIDIKHFEGDPGAEKLKSDAIVCAVVDEAAHLPSPDSLVALQGRCLDAGGRLFLATTPRPDHYLKDTVVDAAQAFERLPADAPERASGEHEGARWRVVPFAIVSNPWLDPEVVRRDMAALDMEDPAVRRDWLGEWIANSGILWREFSVERHVHLDEGRTAAEMRSTLLARCKGGVDKHGHPLPPATVDITPAVARRLFQTRTNPHFRQIRATNLSYILASDFNCHPMSTCVLQVVAPPGAGPSEAAEDKDRWHVLVIDLVQSAHSNSLAHAERLVDMTWIRTWAPTATRSPYLGCGMICDPTALSRDPTAHRHGRNPHGLAETLGKLGFDGRAPQYKIEQDGPKAVHTTRYDSHTLLHRLLKEDRLHISQRVVAAPVSLITAFLQQQDSGDGVVPLTRSHTKSDELASSVDALRYGCWAIFKG
jgi:hypothetical protein